jgi:hypothetical protein
MSKDIKYAGPHDAFEVTAADMKNAGYEGDGFAKSRFEAGAVYTVDDEAAADILLSHEDFPGFVEATEKDLEDLETDDDEDSADKTKSTGPNEGAGSSAAGSTSSTSTGAVGASTARSSKGRSKGSTNS